MNFFKSGRNQAGVEDASLALAEAQSSIVDLFTQIRDIKTKAAESEATGQLISECLFPKTNSKI